MSWRLSLVENSLMRILHIIWSLNVGGAESMLADIINEQSKLHDVHLIIVNQVESLSLSGMISNKVVVHRFCRKPGSRNVFSAFLFNLKLLKLRPDVIHFHNHDLINLFLLTRIQKAKLYLTLHSTGIPTKNLGKFNNIFAISESVKRDIQDRVRISPQIVFNGIPSDSIKKKSDFNYDKFQIIQIGRLYHEVKGQDILLKALNYLINTLKVKNISVDFIGDGPSSKYLFELANKLEIQNFCNFFGFKDRKWIYEHLCEYQLLVQPSRYEGFGLTIVEALVARVPVLVSNVEGPMELICNGRYGYSFKSEDSCDLVDKIFTIMKEYKSQNFKRKIDAGYAQAIQLYDIKHTVSNYLKQYKSK